MKPKYFKRILACCLSYMLLLTLTGCGKNVVSTTESVDESNKPIDSTEESRTSADTTTDETIKDETPTREVIVNENVVYIASTKAPHISEEHQKVVNEYLAKVGCDYSIKYVIFSKEGEMSLKYPVNEYCTDIMNYINGGNQLDICFSSYALSWTDKSSYDVLIDRKMIEPIDEYLASDKGRALYDSIPEARWESLKRDGHIYGISACSSESCTSPSFIFNKNLLEKYGYTEADVNCGMDELALIIRTISEGESQNPRYKAIIINDYMDQWYSFYMPNSKMEYIGINSDGKAELVHDNSECQTLLRDVSKLAKDSGTKMSLINPSIYFKDCLMTVSWWTIPWYNSMRSQSFYDESATYNEIIADPQDYVVTHPYGAMTTSITRNAINNHCILSTSKNKERAYDFLTRAFSDSKLSDLLMFGVEDESYEIRDGVIYLKGMVDGETELFSYGPYQGLIGNTYISTPTAHELANKEAILEKVKTQILAPRYTDYLYKLSRNIRVYNKVQGICAGFIGNMVNAEDFETFYSEYRSQLREAGLDELLADIQKDFDEWRQSQ